MPMTPLDPIYSPQQAGQALKGLVAQERFLSSPFIRWLLEQEQTMNLPGLLEQARQKLEDMRTWQVPEQPLPPLTQGMQGQPGVSNETAPPQLFRDLLGQLQAILQSQMSLQPYMLPVGIRDRVFPPSQRLIPPAPRGPGQPY